MTTNRRNIIELKEMNAESTLQEVIQTYNANITEINYIMRSLTLSNLDGEIKTVAIPAGSTVKVSHKLGIIPKYKLLLKQVGGGLIRDVQFTAKYIELENIGIVDATVTVIIVKD